MILSILISSTPQRKEYLEKLLSTLAPQMNDKDGLMEVIVEMNGQSLPEKLNSLIADSFGKYIWILNDSDIVSSFAVDEILKAAEKDPDYILIGMSQDGDEHNHWEMRLAFDKTFKSYYPVKKELAGKFPKTGNGWVTRIRKKVTTAESINRLIVHRRGA